MTAGLGRRRCKVAVDETGARESPKADEVTKNRDKKHADVEGHDRQHQQIPKRHPDPVQGSPPNPSGGSTVHLGGAVVGVAEGGKPLDEEGEDEDDDQG